MNPNKNWQTSETVLSCFKGTGLQVNPRGTRRQPHFRNSEHQISRVHKERRIGSVTGTKRQHYGPNVQNERTENKEMINKWCLAIAKTTNLMN